MKRNSIMLVLLTALVLVLAACQDTADEANSTSNSESEENSEAEQSTENSSEETETSEADEQGASTEDASEETPVEEPSESPGNGDTEEPASKKQEYLSKLDELDQEMTEMMENSTASNTVEMKKEASDRWEAWDGLLNEIYAVLEEQLSPEEMEALRVKQREWIEYRDATAKEASLKYEGGTQENVEYTAVMADVTQERCYELVNEYMK
ncbi:lysozyme inhibitor LprI family protein [Cytobacillus gottheilii]|uniref:lysozyme inhibitor LprI family protein n=1 Tax=Cytobacillus gottheilii TaxID=859144 RepID=UPI0009BC5405|nr:lysozyme inhibitor LprI family protein [Cytobacillus gottheilii]